MNATDLQRLREKLETSKRSHETYIALRISEVEELLAERAVSPAESVQSVDTPEFRSLLGRWHAAGPGTHTVAAFLNLIAHIDASRAAAHAEGRRSALEELHPQWLKEKERAEVAEAERDNLNDVAEKRRKEIARLDAMLASRQAPDLSSAIQARIAHHEAKLADENDIHCGCSSTIISELQALLAQPLQQEGGKDDLVRQVVLSQAAYHVKHGYKSAPLAAKLESLLRPSDNLQQASTAQVDQRSTSLGEKADELLAYLDDLHISSRIVEEVREALDTPVASDTDTEKAMQDALVYGTGTTIGGKHVPYAELFKSVGDSGLPLDIENLECTEQERWWNEWSAKHPLNAKHSPARAALEAWIERAKRAVSAQATPEGAAHKTEYKSEFSLFANSENSTPEGADLPPVPTHPESAALYWSDMERAAIKKYGEDCARAALAASQQAIAHESEGWTWLQCPHCDSGVKTIQMGAATTAAEPVAWCEKDGDEWIVYDANSDTGKHIAMYQKEHHGIDVFPIYGRAAPPQQVDTGGLPG